MTINPEISVGNILTIVSLALSVIALIVTINRDQELKRKEYADRIRRSASTTVAKLNRWRDLTVQFFDEIQPLITEADMLLVKDKNVLTARDTFWKGLGEARIKIAQRIIEEQIEIAYVELYGYDPRIQTLFTEVIDRLKIIDLNFFQQALYSTQNEILGLRAQKKPYVSAQLGNQLRNTCYEISSECKRLMDDAIEPFGKEMIALIGSDDKKIVERKITVRSVSTLYPVSLRHFRSMMEKRVAKELEKSREIKRTLEMVGTPITRDGKLLGMLSIDSAHQETISKRDIELMEDFAEKASVAIKLAEKNGKKARGTGLKVNLIKKRR